MGRLSDRINRLAKRTNRSHLTDREKTHTMGLVFFGVLLFMSGGIAALFFHLRVELGTVAVVGFCMLGTWFVAFPWGYIGAMEDERSGS